MYGNSNVRYDSTNVRLLRESPYVRQLQNARRAAGGDKQLAVALRTSRKALSNWLSGKEAPPMKTYMAALHLAGRNARLRDPAELPRPAGETQRVPASVS